MIHLVYAATPVYGGWVTFTAHLQLALRSVGKASGVAKIAKRYEPNGRNFLGEVYYQNLPAEAMTGQVVIAALDKAHIEAVRPVINRAWVVVHDPTEVNDLSRPLLQAARGLVVIREKNMAMAQDLNRNTVFVPHPFEVQPEDKPIRRTTRAVSLSRLDWDKHIDIIVKANAMLPAGNRVQIYGAENRLYTHHKLTAETPDWRKDYHGSFSRSSVLGGYNLARTAEWAVDMSAIKGDGGGTQYTFLEAIAAGAALVLNAKWFTAGEDSVLKPGVNCQAVESADDLCSLMSSSPQPHLTENASQILRQHEYPAVAGQWLSLLRSF